MLWPVCVFPNKSHSLSSPHTGCNINEQGPISCYTTHCSVYLVHCPCGLCCISKSLQALCVASVNTELILAVHSLLIYSWLVITVTKKPRGGN